MNISTLWKIMAGPAMGAALALAWMAFAPQEAAHAAPPCSEPLATCEQPIDTKDLDYVPTVTPLVNYAPDAEIISPMQYEKFAAPEGANRSCNRIGQCSVYSADTVLVGQGTDREDGTLTGTSVSWTVNIITQGIALQPGVGPALVRHPYMQGVGETFPIKLFAYDPLITSYEVTLSVMDSHGVVTTDTAYISVFRDFDFSDFLRDYVGNPCDDPSFAERARQYGAC